MGSELLLKEECKHERMYNHPDNWHLRCCSDCDFIFAIPSTWEFRVFEKFKNLENRIKELEKEKKSC